jgi:hypothetical protein
MKKTNQKIVIAALALVIGGIFAFVSCRWAEAETYNGEVPVGHVMSGNTELADGEAGSGDYRFEISWKNVDTDEEALEAMKACFDKWAYYVLLFEPRPFYNKSSPGEAIVAGTGSTPYAVFSDGAGGWKLDNTDPDTNGNIIIKRAWPREFIDAKPPIAKNRVTWQQNPEYRVRGFKQEMARIQGMMDDIINCERYNLTDGSIIPLHALTESMGNFISYNPDTPVDRTAFDLNTSGTGTVNGKIPASLPNASTSALYEFYFGYVPSPADYRNPAGPLAFPE